MPAGIAWQPCLQFRAIRGNKPATCQIAFGCTNLGWHRTAILKNKIWVFLSKTCVIFRVRVSVWFSSFPLPLQIMSKSFRKEQESPATHHLCCSPFPVPFLKWSYPGHNCIHGNWESLDSAMCLVSFLGWWSDRMMEILQKATDQPWVKSFTTKSSNSTTGEKSSSILIFKVCFLGKEVHFKCHYLM